jgi:GNAT superfamily N-acetyltransferase
MDTLMSDDSLHVETNPDRREIRILEDGLYEFNVAATGIDDGEDLAIFVRDENRKIRGGLYGWTWSGWLEISRLWVRAEERGKGLGSRLLAAAEAEGKRRGAHTAILDTHTFQAAAFYQKRGYRVYASLDGYPTGHGKVFLRKSLRE